MKRFISGLLILACMASYSLAGDAGVTNTVTKMTPSGSRSMRDSLIKTINDMITRFDAIMGSQTTLSVSQEILQDGSVAANNNVTNAEIITLSGFVVPMTGTGQTTAETNDVTFSVVPSSAVGSMFYVYNATGATNLLAFAVSGVFKSPAVELAAAEGVWLYAGATNEIYTANP